MRVPVVLLLAALCACAPRCRAAPRVFSADKDALVVVREVGEDGEDGVAAPRADMATDGLRYVVDGVGDDDGADDVLDGVEAMGAVAVREEEVVEMDVEVEVGVVQASAATTHPPPPHRCKLRQCWRGCQKRGYNWGLCLCKKCHCYY